MLAIDDGTALAWLDSAPGAKPLTKASYLRSLGIFDAFLAQEGIGFDCVARSDFEKFSRQVRASQRATIAEAALRATKRFYSWAAAGGICRDASPQRGYATEFYESHYTRAQMGEAEAVSAISATRCARDRAMVSLAVRCDLKPREILSLRACETLLYGDSGEVRLADGMWMPLTAACACDIEEHVERRCAEAPCGLLFAAMSREMRGVSLSPRTLRGILSRAFRDAGVDDNGGYLWHGSAALGLAIAEGEPADVIVALSDRSFRYRQAAKSKRARQRPPEPL